MTYTKEETIVCPICSGQMREQSEELPEWDEHVYWMLCLECGYKEV